MIISTPYRCLRRYNRVVPHICIGIMGGRIESVPGRYKSCGGGGGGD